MTLTDDQFRALLGHIDPEVLHAFAMTVYDAAWSDGADKQPLYRAEPEIARFIARVAAEHGAQYAERQETRRPAFWEPPEWLERMGE